ncbi:CAN2 protein, partial [Polyodon spathula]|nr:CAN2 protein [Polyodon spathula]
MSSIAEKLAKERARAQGFGSNTNAVKFLRQDFEVLRRQCLESGTLFNDDMFPAKPESLGFKELSRCSGKTQGVEWKRPTNSSTHSLTSVYLTGSTPVLTASPEAI